MRVLTSVLFLLWFSGGRAGAQQATPTVLRVMTYNIHHAEGLDKKVDVKRIADLIKREQADIVALQEVDKGVDRTAKRNLPAEFAELTGLTCVFSNNYHFQGGEYGNAVLTRFPVIQWTNTHYKMLKPDEQRGLLQLVLKVHGHELLFMDTHIDFRSDDSERLSNVEEIKGVVQRYRGRAMILCGDFNDVPTSRTHDQLAEIFSDAWTMAGTGDGFTIPAAKPRKRIDFIWIGKDGPLVPLKVWVPDSEASDHRPVVAEFRFK